MIKKKKQKKRDKQTKNQDKTNYGFIFMYAILLIEGVYLCFSTLQYGKQYVKAGECHLNVTLSNRVCLSLLTHLVQKRYNY